MVQYSLYVNQHKCFKIFVLLITERSVKIFLTSMGVKKAGGKPNEEQDIYMVLKRFPIYCLLVARRE